MQYYFSKTCTLFFRMLFYLCVLGLFTPLQSTNLNAFKTSCEIDLYSTNNEIIFRGSFLNYKSSELYKCDPTYCELIFLFETKSNSSYTSASVVGRNFTFDKTYNIATLNNISLNDTGKYIFATDHQKSNVILYNVFINISYHNATETLESKDSQYSFIGDNMVSFVILICTLVVSVLSNMFQFYLNINHMNLNLFRCI